MRLVIGDALHALGHLGAAALRLDANGFLGVEKSAEGGAPAWSEGHPLSEAVNQLIASMVRKVGGFTFQELNLSFDDIKKTAERGADLSYDFVNRPAYAHAIATADTEFLRLTLNAALQHGLQPVRLVHALQNHDEMTYELVHFAIGHKDDSFRFRGSELTGGELAIKIRNELIERLTGEAAPYNATFTTNGIASTSGTCPRPRSRRSSRPTCSWPCSTHGSLECSRCPAGTSAACSLWSDPRFPGSWHPATPAGSTGQPTT
jgi:trehalose synthase